jgi:hypothetical protein
MIPTMSGINALVIGVGHFGRHHARILSELNARCLASLPVIEKLIVTRTRLDRAKAAAAAIRNSISCSVNTVIGAEVGNMRQLISVLEQYQPRFTSITARDKQRGDSIHADYTIQALKYGAVLCEKPFSHASGDGSSLRYFHELQAYGNAKLFGLELPLAVVARDILKDRYLGKIMMQADRLEFYWEAWHRGEKKIIDDLVLHPWSLIPDTFMVEIRRVDDRGTGADLSLHLFNRQTKMNLPCKISLNIGAGFRGLQVDGMVIGFKSEASGIQIIKLNQPLNQAAKTGIKNLSGQVLLVVDNPLKQHIVAALCHRPIIGLRRTHDSQLFLERLRGYRN